MTLSGPEGKTLEFKRDLPTSEGALKTIVASSIEQSSGCSASSKCSTGTSIQIVRGVRRWAGSESVVRASDSAKTAGKRSAHSRSASISSSRGSASPREHPTAPTSAAT